MKDAVIERLFEYLENKRVRDSELAEILGITRSNPGQWKRGVNAPTLKNFIAILDYFPDLNVEWLFRGDKQNKNNQIVTGNENTTAFAGNNISMESGSIYQTENKYLKQLLKEKDEQIKLLKDAIKQK